jgi:threonine synthase
MRFYPTRGGDQSLEFCDAMLSPAAPFNGLYAPKSLPCINDFEALKSLSYAELAHVIIKSFDVDLDDEILSEALKTYEHFDDPSEPVALRKISETLFVCELWHGPTRAFKDMALQPFGVILSRLAQKKGEKYLILAATSGDTGPATLATFANRANVEAVCLYPHGGTSGVQELQMTSFAASNLNSIAIEGSFDDAQSALKQLLASETFHAALQERRRSLSAANSVNIARVLFQIVYHIYSWLCLRKRNEIKSGEPIDIIVPSGNFGNALGAYYARKMGLPIAKIIITSNENNILTDLIITGKYDLNNRPLIKTSSPAMDILKSSNIERLLFDLFGSHRTRGQMENLAQSGAFELSASELNSLQDIFDAAWSTEKEVALAMKHKAQSGYIVDPHTATCFKALKHGKSRAQVICSTAEWTKFAPSLLYAITGERKKDSEALEAISTAFNLPISSAISELFKKNIHKNPPISPHKIEEEIIRFLER